MCVCVCVGVCVYVCVEDCKSDKKHQYRNKMIEVTSLSLRQILLEVCICRRDTWDSEVKSRLINPSVVVAIKLDIMLNVKKKIPTEKVPVFHITQDLS